MWPSPSHNKVGTRKYRLRSSIAGLPVPLADATPRLSPTSAYGSRSKRVANPSSQDSFIPYSKPVYPGAFCASRSWWIIILPLPHNRLGTRSELDCGGEGVTSFRDAHTWGEVPAEPARHVALIRRDRPLQYPGDSTLKSRVKSPLRLGRSLALPNGSTTTSLIGYE